MPERDESNHLILFAHVLAKFQFIEEGIRIYVRDGSGWLDRMCSFLSGASRVADYAAVSRAGRLS